LCERLDFHVCGAGGGLTFGADNEDKTFCLQVTLRLPRFFTESGNFPAISGLKCTGWNFGLDYLWATDSIGRITVWRVPEVEGFDFIPVRSWRAHRAAICAFECTWKHAVTAGDDALIILHDLASLTKVRTLDLTMWSYDLGLIVDKTVPRRVKCLSVTHCTDYEPGSVVVGCCTGEVFIFGTGYCA
jgi:hypothetical protein